jgi:hypothetical protein
MGSVTERRAKLYSLLGRLPERDRPIGATTLSVEHRAGYVLERLLLDLNGVEPVPAVFVRPLDQRGPFPGVMYNHAHGGEYQIGKSELIEGRGALQRPPYAEELTRAGYAALCIDHWAFGERAGRSESEVFKHMIWRGQVMWGMMVYDSVRALDYLVSRGDVDGARVASMGMSMGSTMAWWHAALDERVKVCVDLCCLTDYEELIAIGNLDGHGIYYYVPDLLTHFSAGEINALIAPRSHLSVVAVHDRLTPMRGVERIDGQLRRAYAAAGAAENWQLRLHHCGHLETAAMRWQVMAFLRERL